jgi:CRISPR-associated protein (TIGR03984 family)
VERKIVNGTRAEEPITVPPDADLCRWLAGQAQTHGLRWLLAHADNGVIWGELRDNALHLSSDAFGPVELALDRETLQQARLFGAAGELRLWRGPDRFEAHLLCDGAGVPVEHLDETYLLWGTSARATKDGFSELVEGAQGIVHAPPISVAPTEKQRATLLVRHYLGEDEAGVVRVVDSRLVALTKPA